MPAPMPAQHGRAPLAPSTAPIGRATLPPRPVLTESGDGAAYARLEAAKRVMAVFLNRFDPRELPQTYPPDNQLRERVYAELARCVDEVAQQFPPGVDRNAVLDHVANEAVALGSLEYFLDDDSVTDVYINGPENILLEQPHGLTLAGHGYTSSDFLYLTAQRLLSMQGFSAANAPPHNEVRFSDGTLVQVILPPVAVGSPVITVRKARRALPGLRELIDGGSLSEDMAEFLRQSVDARRTFLVVGPAGSGRTSIVNALLGLVPDGARIIAIESTSMLHLPQRSAIALETQPRSSYGPAVSKEELASYALRMRPDRIVIDDMSAGEASVFLQAAAAGAAGSVGVVAGFGASDGLMRLEQLALVAAGPSGHAGVSEQVERGVDIVIVTHRFADGTRRVTEIAELDGGARPVFVFEQTGMGRAAGGEGTFQSTGYVPRFYRELNNGGESLDLGIFRK